MHMHTQMAYILVKINGTSVNREGGCHAMPLVRKNMIYGMWVVNVGALPDKGGIMIKCI